MVNALADCRERNIRLEAERKNLEDELAYLKHTLGYRVGAAIVNNLSLRGIWRMPEALFRAIRAYRKSKGKLTAPKGGIAAQRSSDVRVDPHWPEPVERHLLWQALHLAEEHSVFNAIEFVEAFGSERHASGLNILKSNLFIASDEQWLAGVNAYLAPFKIAPIKLKQGTEPRFYRLGSDELEGIQGGPLVSVIMPAFNSEDSLSLAMHSILDQTWKNLELIVVDDCSSDSTQDVAAAIAAGDSRVTVLSNSHNVGPYVSKNRALALAKGDFVTGHDADDWAHPQRLEKQVQAMREQPRWQVSISYMLRVREDGYFSHFSKLGRTSPDGVLRLASISCFFRREFMQQTLGYWDSVRFGADSEMIDRCRQILGDDEFGTLQMMTMMCLDGESSLTNHPEHGISKLTGVSPTRVHYREQWSAWHSGLKRSAAYVDFPQNPRIFGAPDEALVATQTIMQVLKADVRD